MDDMEITFQPQEHKSAGRECSQSNANQIIADVPFSSRQFHGRVCERFSPVKRWVSKYPFRVFRA